MSFPKEMDIFVHGPFSTGLVFDLSKSNFNLEELSEFSQSSEGLIKDSYKQAIMDETERTYPVLINKRRRQFELMQVQLSVPKPKKYDFANINFEKIAVSFYAYGTAVLSIHVKITFDEDPNVKIIKMADKELEMIIKEFFEKKVLELRKSFYNAIRKHNFPVIKEMGFEPSDENSFAWLHKIYWFRGPEFFDGDRLKIELYNQFCALLGQRPENMSPFLDRYVYYGDGRSIIINKNANSSANLEETVQLLKVLEVSQYFCLSLYQLHEYLTGKTINMEIETDLEILKDQIKQLNIIRLVAFRYLEQFKHGFNILFQSMYASIT